MSSVTDVTIGATSTSVMTSAESRAMGSPLYVKNESDTVMVLVVSGSDDYDLDPGEPYRILPGQAVTASAVGGSKLLQIIAGVAPVNETAAMGPGVSAADPLYTSTVITGAAPNVPAGGAGMWSVGQDDFTAVWASATTLTLGTFPTALGTPIGGNFFLVVETLASGEQINYAPVDYPMSLTGQVLTVTGAAFVETTSTFDVFCWGPPRGYDASVNADQTYPLLSPRKPQDSPQKSDSSLGDGTHHEYFDTEQGQDFTVRILDTPGTAGDNTYTLWTSQLNDATAEASADYQDRTLELVGQATVASAEIAADPSIGVWQLNGIQAKRVRVTCVRANDGANTDGAYQYDAMWM